MFKRILLTLLVLSSGYIVLAQDAPTEETPVEVTEEEIQAAMAELEAEGAEVAETTEEEAAPTVEAEPVAAEEAAVEPAAEAEPVEADVAAATEETTPTPTAVKTFATIPTTGAPEAETPPPETEMAQTTTPTEPAVTPEPAKEEEEATIEEVESTTPATTSSEVPNKKLLNKLDELINRVMTIENLIIKLRTESQEQETRDLGFYEEFEEDPDVL